MNPGESKAHCRRQAQPLVAWASKSLLGVRILCPNTTPFTPQPFSECRVYHCAGPTHDSMCPWPQPSAGQHYGSRLWDRLPQLTDLACKIQVSHLKDRSKDSASSGHQGHCRGSSWPPSLWLNRVCSLVTLNRSENRGAGQARQKEKLAQALTLASGVRAMGAARDC